MFLAVDYHAAPGLAVSEMHSPMTHACLQNASSLFPLCFTFFFKFYFNFWEDCCHSRNINDGNLRASCVVLARCRSRIGWLHET